MELIRHTRRRSRGHARKHAERIHAATPRHDHDATCKAIINDCADREWQRERSHARMDVAPLPAANAAETGATTPNHVAPSPAATSGADHTADFAAPAPLSAPLAASFPPLGL